MPLLHRRKACRQKKDQRLRSAPEDLPGVRLEGPTGYEKFRQLPRSRARLTRYNRWAIFFEPSS